MQYTKEYLLDPANAKAYLSGVKGKFFNRFMFWRSMTFAVAQSLFMFYMQYSTTSHAIDSSGNMATLFMLGNSLYFYVCILINLELMTQSNNYPWLSVVIILASMLSAVLFYLILSIVPNNPMYHTFHHLFTNTTYLSLLLISTVANVLFSILINRVRDVVEQLLNKFTNKMLPAEETQKKIQFENGITIIRLWIRVFSRRKA